MQSEIEPKKKKNTKNKPKKSADFRAQHKVYKRIRNMTVQGGKNNKDIQTNKIAKHF